MTFIQPNKTSPFINKILTMLIVALILASFLLVILYNRVVNLSHGITELDLEIKKTQTDMAELKDKIFHAFNTAIQGEIAKNRELVKENNPQYLETRPHAAVPRELVISQSTQQ